VLAATASAVTSSGLMGVSHATTPSFVQGLVCQFSARWRSSRLLEPKASAGKQGRRSTDFQDLLPRGDTVTDAAEEFYSEAFGVCSTNTSASAEAANSESFRTTKDLPLTQLRRRGAELAQLLTDSEAVGSICDTLMSQAAILCKFAKQAKSLASPPSDFMAGLSEVFRSLEDVEDQIEKASGRDTSSTAAASRRVLPTSAKGVESKEASPAPYGLVAHDSLARRTAGGDWAVPVQAWIYRTNQKRHRIRMAICRKLLVQMRHGIKDIDAEAERRYEERGRLIFRTLVFRGGERNTVLEVKFDNDSVWMPLPPTTGDGRVKAEFVLSNEVVQRAVDGRLGMTVRIPQSKAGGQSVVARAEVLLTEPEGVLVVSDIDDTVKVTEVFMGKDQVVRNTFLEEFRPVNGMATLYNSWAKDFGATFAFVSNSPPEFLEPLREFLWDSGFPRAPVQLRPLGGKKELRLEFKQVEIEDILAKYPHRKVVLVGDSGERDPMVCAELMRKHPEQVIKVLIRQVHPDATVDAAVFRGLPRSSWQVFTDPAEAVLPDALRAASPAASPMESEDSAPGWAQLLRRCQTSCRMVLSSWWARKA